MTDHPIIFSASMVRALLDGRKSQTRRLAKAACGRCKPGPHFCTYCGDLGWRPSPWQRVQPGERLWVKEAGCWTVGHDHVTRGQLGIITYRATFEGDRPPSADGKWKSPRFMPRWASRLTLTVTEVRRQRLLDISEEDAVAEGFAAGYLNDGFGPVPFVNGCTIESPGTLCSAAGAFLLAWQKLHPDWDGYDSPEVIALTFSVERRNIDASERAAEEVRR